MATARTWTIKGVSDRTRDAVYEACQAAGLTIGEWIDKALAQAAEEALHPKPPAATREDVADVVREQLAPILARLEALEGKAGQGARARAPIKRADVGPARAAVRGEVPGRPRRRLTEEVQTRIEELHRAGRSAYAISKELGVSYGAVQARVKALQGERPPLPAHDTPLNATDPAGTREEPRPCRAGRLQGGKAHRVFYRMILKRNVLPIVEELGQI